MVSVLSFVVLFLLNVVVRSELTVEGHDPDCTIIDETEFEFATCHENLANDYLCTLSQIQQDWLTSLWKEALQDRPYPLRKRREIRVLSDTERSKYFKAINDLKADTTIAPNKYDTLALIHTNLTLCSVHQGSNFLGWHRVYLLLYETALRQKDKSVVLPYWNSLFDNQNITSPNNTILFTKNFIGNGNGNVNDGPFKNWRDKYNCPLFRNIAKPNSTLPSPEIVGTIENDNSIVLVKDVIDHLGSAERNKTIEGQHNLPHDWVGGMMDFLPSSPKDPAFFLHHAYVDYIWEKFRQKQQRLGEDPEYCPGLGTVEWNGNNTVVKYNLTLFHASHRQMDCFHWMKSIDGYSKNFTQYLYAYEDSPAYPNCGNSEYLKWSTVLDRCIGINPATELNNGSSTSPQSFKPYYGRLILFLFFLVYFGKRF